MNKRVASIFGGVALGLLPTVVFAATQNGGLVPCTDGISCNVCDFYKLAQNIINFLIELSIPIAVLLFAYAGALYFTSGAKPDNIGRAKKIFSSAFIGFMIAISGWLVVQTIINVLVKKEFQVDWHWNSLDCTNINRPGVTGPHANITVSDWLNGVLGTLSAPVTVAPTPPVGGGPGCNNAASSCYQCYSAMQALNQVQTGLQTPTQRICYQALQFIGTDTSGGALTPTNSQCGPSPGSAACAWSVNTILGYAGIAPIWNQCNLVPWPYQLRSGIVQLKDSSQATCGDLVIEGSDGHIGICADKGCTLAISNSSTPKTFTQCTGPDLDNPGVNPLGYFRVEQ